MKPINTLLGVRVSMSCYSSLQSKERILAFILEISTISVPRHNEKSSGRRSWCFRDPLRLQSCLHRLESIRKPLDQRYVTLFSRSIFSMVSLLFFNTYLSATIDLESLKDSCMHRTRFKAWEQSNPRFPTKTLTSTLEISTILVHKHKEESLDGRSWVYEKRTRITQATCTRIAQDAMSTNSF